MKQHFWTKIIDLIDQNIILIMAAIFSLGAKVAIDSKMKKLSIGEVAGKFLIGGASGFIWFNYCAAHGLLKDAAWSVPLVTMLGESIILLLMKNLSSIVKHFVTSNTGVKEKEWKE